MKSYRLSPDEIYNLKKIERYGGTYAFQRWPEIYWGTPLSQPKELELSELPTNRYDTEMLGGYHYGENEEGHIELYRDRINDCAYRIAVDLRLDFETTYADLCYIVLMHEMGHWFTHWCHKDAFMDRRTGYLSQPSEVKETLAQLTVVWSFARLSNTKVNRRKSIFFYLAKKQSYPYQQVLKFEEFYTKRGTILRRFNDLLDEKEWGIEYLLDGKKHGLIHKEFKAEKTVSLRKKK